VDIIKILLYFQEEMMVQ